jgi:hypothetical protein
MYTACLHMALIVPSCVAFTLLVQNYLCTNLPGIYTVVHNLLCTTSTIILLIPISLILLPKYCYIPLSILSQSHINSSDALIRGHSRIYCCLGWIWDSLRIHLFPGASYISLHICILYSYLPLPSFSDSYLPLPLPLYYSHVFICNSSVQYLVIWTWHKGKTTI